MTFTMFSDSVRSLATLIPFSITSWGRTEKRNKLVGGHPRSWHRLWLAVDVIPDKWSDLSMIRKEAARFGLKVLNESDHWHIQPAPRR